MKTTRFFSLALAALMLGACSDVTDLNGNQESNLVGEKGYVCFTINLPTQPSTRTDGGNDVFNDGIAQEYNVNDATLLIFSGDDEFNATFSGAYNLTHSFKFQNPTDDNITSNSQIVQEITRPSGTYCYALVVLNKNGLLSESSGTWKYGEKTFSSTTKFSDFADEIMELDLTKIASTTSGNGNFLMLNAPLYTVQGSTVEPAANGKLITLEKIDKSKIYATQTQAVTNPAAEIFVERAVAKVTVTQGASFDGGTNAATLQGWTLDVTNKKSYPIRKIETTSGSEWWSYYNSKATVDKYRFVGAAQVTANRYRTYWGIDPNYNGTDSETSQSYRGSNGNVLDNYKGFNTLYGTIPTSLNNIGANEYCLENTFDVENQRKDQTTRVIVAAKLSVSGADTDGNFYTWNDDKSTIYNKTNIENLIKQAYLDNSTVQALLHDDEEGLDMGKVLDGTYIKVKFAKGNDKAEDIASLKGGIITVDEIYVDASAANLFKKGTVPAGLSANNTTVTADLNANKISFYKEGVAYYPIQIKHFGDKQTPWNGIDDGYSESYPGTEEERNNNWLGRYGVLRNNWYQIEVTAVKNIGSAEVEPETGYDDPVNAWISVKINILSWALRKQSVSL